MERVKVLVEEGPGDAFQASELGTLPVPPESRKAASPVSQAGAPASRPRPDGEGPEAWRELSDEELLRRVKEGAREAFALLVERHKRGILNFLYRYCGDRDWSEDLAQETFLRAFTNRDRFNERWKFSTWLYTIARNLSIDLARRRKGESEFYDRFAQGPAAPREPEPPQAALMREETARAVRTALARLPERFRSVFVLCVLQDMRYEEASQVLKVPVKTISSRLARARARFTREFARLNHEV